MRAISIAFYLLLLLTQYCDFLSFHQSSGDGKDCVSHSIRHTSFIVVKATHFMGPEGRFQCREPNHNGATRRLAADADEEMEEGKEEGGGEGGGQRRKLTNVELNTNPATAHKKRERRFLAIGGNGAGIGNFLIFYPAAYYFAVLTGREIVIIDGSLIGELCSMIYCGFPLLSEIAEAFPSLISKDIYNNGVINHGAIKGAKVWEMHQHLAHEIDLDTHTLVRADGYKFSSGWYFGRNYTMACVTQLTGCDHEDVSCQDRHAFQRLIKGPFRPSEWLKNEENRIIGVPKNLKHAMLYFPHATAPRIDAAVHLRCQFKHFEYSIGPDDGVHWDTALKEIHDWLNSTDNNKGYQLFKHVEDKIISEHEAIVKLSQQVKDKRRRTMQLEALLDKHDILSVDPKDFRAGKNDINLESKSLSGERRSVGSYIHTMQHVITSFLFKETRKGLRVDSSDRKNQGENPLDIAESHVHTSNFDQSSNWYARRNLAAGINFNDNVTNSSLFEMLDHENEASQYQGDMLADNKIYVFIASDNDVIKEAFTRYLVANQKKREETNHPIKIAVMRVKNRANIAHAKNLNYLRSAGNETGVFDLSLDWYFLTLANHIFAWRRDTDMLSTFAHSSQRVSGSNELSNPNDAEMDSGIGTLGYQLIFNRHGQPFWRNYS